MKENNTQLYPNEQVATSVSDYSFAHSSKIPKFQEEYHAFGIESQKRSNYMISPLQAEFQIWFTKALGAKRSALLIPFCSSDSVIFFIVIVLKLLR